MTKPATEALVAAVRRHALDNYERDGWDILTECWGDEEIAKEIGEARTERGAIRRCKAALAPLAEHRDDVRATSDW